MSNLTINDQARLHDFMGRAVQEIAAAYSVPLAILGERLGIYRAMAGQKPVTPAELSQSTDLDERYLREWLCAQAAGGFIQFHPEYEPEERFSLPEAHAPALVDQDSPYYLMGGYDAIIAAFQDIPIIEQAFRSGRGVGWGEHHPCLFQGTERFYRAAYIGSLIQEWLPSLEGVVEKLKAGAKVADVGCGNAASTILMAQAFPKSVFIGIDNHAPSIAVARERALEAGVADRISFSLAQAQDYQETDLDLVCLFDCLHDMGDPVGAISHIRQTLKADGTLLIVEPFANDRLADNINPVGRIFYAASTLFCTPSARAQPGGMALGAQAGEARLREVVLQGGMTHFRRAAATPFNLILEAKL